MLYWACEWFAFLFLAVLSAALVWVLLLKQLHQPPNVTLPADDLYVVDVLQAVRELQPRNLRLYLLDSDGLHYAGYEVERCYNNILKLFAPTHVCVLQISVYQLQKLLKSRHPETQRRLAWLYYLTPTGYEVVRKEIL